MTQMNDSSYVKGKEKCRTASIYTNNANVPATPTLSKVTREENFMTRNMDKLCIFVCSLTMYVLFLSFGS